MTSDTTTTFIGIGLGILLYCVMACSKRLSRHEACKPAPKRGNSPKTTQRCKNAKCGRIVSVRKITGEYCTYCHVEHAPTPKPPEPKETKVAIAAEVIDNA